MFATQGSMTAAWVVLMIVFLVIEGIVPGLVSIWFALGSLAALISAMLGAQLWVQALWFVLISVAALAVTRPLAKKYVNSRTQATNADMLIVGGTSLNVYPAAGLINYYRGNKLVLVNRSATSYDSYADLVIQSPSSNASRASN